MLRTGMNPVELNIPTNAKEVKTTGLEKSGKTEPAPISENEFNELLNVLENEGPEALMTKLDDLAEKGRITDLKKDGNQVTFKSGGKEYSIELPEEKPNPTYYASDWGKNWRALRNALNEGKGRARVGDTYMGATITKIEYYPLGYGIVTDNHIYFIPN